MSHVGCHRLVISLSQNSIQSRVASTHLERIFLNGSPHVKPVKPNPIKPVLPHSSSSPSSSPTPLSTLNTNNHVFPICSWCNLLRYASIARCFGLALDLPDTTIGPSLKGAQLEILSEPAIKFLVALHKTFDPTRKSVRMILPALLYASVASFPTSFPPHSLSPTSSSVSNFRVSLLRIVIGSTTRCPAPT